MQTQTKPNVKKDAQEHLWRCLQQEYGVAPNGFERFKQDNFNLRNKNDSNATKFAGRVLEIINEKIIYQDLPPLWTQALPIKTDLPLAFTKETDFYVSFSGKPQFSTAMTNGIPKVAYRMDNQSHATAIFELGLDVTWQELRTLAVANASTLFPSAFNLLSEKLQAVRRGLMEFEHFTLCYGDADHQLNGILNHPEITPIDYVGSFNPYTVAANNAAELNQWFTITLLEALQNATNEQVNVNALLIPTKLQNKLNNTFLGDSGLSAMQLVKNSLAQLDIKAIVELRTDYLQAYGEKADNENEHRLVMGEFSSDTIDCRVSQIIDDPWGDMGGRGREKLYQKAIRSVIMRKPNKLIYIDFANS